MSTWKTIGLGLACAAGLTPSIWGQVPAVPAAPAAAAGASPTTIWSFLGISKDQKEKMREKCCKKPLGQMFNQMLAPMRAMTGGMFGNFCPPFAPTEEDLKKGGAEGAAAKIQKDEMEAKARRAAVRYLGTVDCHWWPDAELGLIGALLADKNECVRWEAAMALGSGCCCTKNTIAALLLVATGAEKKKTGDPSEQCERVKLAAYHSLQKCLSCYSEEVPIDDKPPIKPEIKPEDKKEAMSSLMRPEYDVRVAAFYKSIENKTKAEVVEEARKAVAESTVAFAAPSPMHTGSRGVFNVINDVYGLNRKTSEPAVAEEEKLTPVAQDEVVSVTPITNGSMPRETVISEHVVSVSKTPAGVVQASPREVTDRVIDMRPMKTEIIEKRESKPWRLFRRNESTSVDMPMETKTEVKPTDMKSVGMKTEPKVESKPVVPAFLPNSQVKASQPQAQSGTNTPQLLNVLRNHQGEFAREWAAVKLSSCNAQHRNEVVSALVASATNDKAVSVRMSCVRSLVKMNANAPQVVIALQSMKNDKDPRVAGEANAALSKLNPIQQTSAVAAPVSARPMAPSSTYQSSGGAFRQMN